MAYAVVILLHEKQNHIYPTVFKTIATDDMKTQSTRVSAAMVLAYFPWTSRYYKGYYLYFLKI